MTYYFVFCMIFQVSTLSRPFWFCLSFHCANVLALLPVHHIFLTLHQITKDKDTQNTYCYCTIFPTIILDDNCMKISETKTGCSNTVWEIRHIHNLGLIFLLVKMSVRSRQLLIKDLNISEKDMVICSFQHSSSTGKI